MADEHDHGHDESEEGRVTAPMQEYTTSEVGIGFAVLVVGLVLTFGVALVAA